MKTAINPLDLQFFSTLAACGSLTAAARELGVTTPAVSKRLAQMEAGTGVTLVRRTTRRMGLTAEGEVLLDHARRILGEIDDLGELIGQTRAVPKGLLRVNATLGFGRGRVAPIVSRFVRRYPDVEARLTLTVDPPPLTDGAFDVCVRFGAPQDARIVARRIAANRRVLAASPNYLKVHGTPKSPADLVRHACITIRQGEEAYGVWRLTLAHGRGARNAKPETVKVRGPLTTNDGSIAVRWALDGHGILMRAEWDIAGELRAGRLVQVLPQYRTPDADIYAVYPPSHQMAARVRVFVDFLAAELARAGN
ncbi:MAG TPA: LysR family transcriptional regulator [Usitatibacteraceae bacterium]|nr:LysR family transcriptional regulator [Usitatibacteraceae bacterium]